MKDSGRIFSFTESMKQELKSKFDSLDFVVDPNKDKFESCLGDDNDSLIGASLYSHVSGVEIGGFYNFKNLYYSDDRDLGKKFVGIDMSLIQEGFRCFDNHVNLSNAAEIGNSQMANINTFNGINLSTYNQKYAGSTVLQMYAYYMEGKQPPTIEGGLILACIDVAFKGHYSNQYKAIHNQYLEDLGLTWMIDLLDKYSINEMYDFMRKIGLDSKIEINKQGYIVNERPWKKSAVTGKWFRDGNLLDIPFIEKNLGFPIIIPQGQFKLARELHSQSKELHEINLNTLDKKNILSLAYTYRNKVELTTLEKLA
ncbi:hypothetical protein [Mesobacillus sp.]|uniref:hypothetical protein n=1 Tax=Mesobacillus sp. TaxID=2675271 RepID=UPI0039EED809